MPPPKSKKGKAAAAVALGLSDDEDASSTSTFQTCAEHFSTDAGDAFDDAVEELTAKRRETREKALATLQACLRASCAQQQCAEHASTLVSRCISCIRRGSDTEAALAAQLLSLLTLTLVDPPEGLLQEVQYDLVRAAGPDSAPQVRAAAVEALALVCFTAGQGEEATLHVMDRCSSLWQQGEPRGCEAAVRAWSLLHTTLPGGPLSQDVLRALLLSLAGLLQQPDVQVRAAAGEALSLLHHSDLTVEVLRELEHGQGGPGADSWRTWESEDEDEGELEAEGWPDGEDMAACNGDRGQSAGAGAAGAQGGLEQAEADVGAGVEVGARSRQRAPQTGLNGVHETQAELVPISAGARPGMAAQTCPGAPTTSATQPSSPTSEQQPHPAPDAVGASTDTLQQGQPCSGSGSGSGSGAGQGTALGGREDHSPGPRPHTLPALQPGAHVPLPQHAGSTEATADAAHVTGLQQSTCGRASTACMAPAGSHQPEPSASEGPPVDAAEAASNQVDVGGQTGKSQEEAVVEQGDVRPASSQGSAPLPEKGGAGRERPPVVLHISKPAASEAGAADGELVRRMRRLATGQNTDALRRSRHDKAIMKTSFRAILAHLEEGRAPVTKIKLQQGDVLVIDTFVGNVQLTYLRRILAAGFQVHLQTNPLLHQVFAFNPQACPPARLSALEKRLYKSPSSAEAKLRTHERNGGRAAKAQRQAMLLTE